MNDNINTELEHIFDPNAVSIFSDLMLIKNELGPAALIDLINYWGDFQSRLANKEYVYNDAIQNFFHYIPDLFSNNVMQPPERIRAINNIMLERHKAWWQSLSTTMRKFLVEAMKIDDDVKTYIIHNIIKKDDAFLAQHIKAQYYIDLADRGEFAPNLSEYVLWFKLWKNVHEDSATNDRGETSKIKEWLNKYFTIKHIAGKNFSAENVVQYLKQSNEMGLLYNFIESGVVKYRDVLSATTDLLIINQLIQSHEYSRHISANIEQIMNHPLVSNDQKWLILREFMSPIASGGDIFIYTNEIAAQYFQFRDYFCDNALDLALLMRYGKTINVDDEKILDWANYIYKHWDDSIIAKLLVHIACSCRDPHTPNEVESRRLQKLKYYIIQHDDLELYKEIEDYLSHYKVKSMDYWSWIEDLGENRSSNVAMKIYSLGTLKKLQGYGQDALMYIKLHPDFGLIQALIKSGNVEYTDVVSSMRNNPEIYNNLLNAVYFFPEIESGLNKLSDLECIDLNTKDSLNNIINQIHKAGEFVGTNDHEQYEPLYKHIKSRIDIIAPNYEDKAMLFHNLLYIKQYWHKDWGYYANYFADGDVAILILAKLLGSEDLALLKKYIIYNDDPEMLKKLFRFIIDNPELNNDIGYLHFISALNESNARLTSFLSNPNNLDNLLDDFELYKYILDHNDIKMADYLIENHIISYPRMWQLSIKFQEHKNLDNLFNNLVDYKKYRYHITYYREYLLKYGHLDMAVKLAIKDPLFAEEALNEIETLYIRDDRNIDWLKQRALSIPKGYMQGAITMQQNNKAMSFDDTHERILMLLERCIAKIFAVALEEDGSESLLEYIVKYHTPLSVFYHIGMAIYEGLEKPLNTINEKVTRPAIDWTNFAFDWASTVLGSLPDTMNPVEVWDNILHKKEHIEWVRSLNAMNIDYTEYMANLSVMSGNVADIPYDIGLHFSALRELLGHIDIGSQVFIARKKKILMDVINVIGQYIKNGSSSYELLMGHDIFGIGGGINEKLLYNARGHGCKEYFEVFNLNHPFYRLLYANPLPLILNAIPFVGKKVTEFVAQYAYPKTAMQIKLIPNDVKWYREHIDNINENTILEYYVQNAPMEVWHVLIETIASPDRIYSPGLDVFRIVRCGTNEGSELLRDISEFVLKFQDTLPKTLFNAAFILYDIASELDWACMQILDLMSKEVVTAGSFYKILFADYRDAVEEHEFFDAIASLGISEFIAVNINRIQYDERQLIKLAFFISRCKISSYMKLIIPKVIDIVTKNANNLFAFTDIPTPQEFIKDLMLCYLAPLDSHIKTFELASLPNEIGLIKTELPKLEIVRDVIMHNNPLDYYNVAISAAARQLAPREIIDWLLNGYTQRFYMVPIDRLSEAERARKTILLENDMRTWIENLLELMVNASIVAPTPFELMNEARYKWWQDLKVYLGNNIGEFIASTSECFDKQQYSRAIIRALCHNSKLLFNEIKIPQLFHNGVREEIMIALADKVVGSDLLLKYMIQNDLEHIKDYSLIAYKLSSTLYNTSVRPVIAQVMSWLSYKITPQPVWNAAINEWVRPLVRHDELFYWLRVLKQFSYDDKLALWGNKQSYNGFTDDHTMLYRTVQVYSDKQSVLAQISMDKNLMSLMLKEIDKMSDPVIQAVYPLAKGIDIAIYKANYLVLGTAKMQNAQKAIINELAPSNTPQFLLTNKLIIELQYHFKYANPPIDVISNYYSLGGNVPFINSMHQNSINTMESLISTFPEPDQILAIAELEYLALCDPSSW